MTHCHILHSVEKFRTNSELLVLVAQTECPTAVLQTNTFLLRSILAKYTLF
jgi:hypothetical protein